MLDLTILVPLLDILGDAGLLALVVVLKLHQLLVKLGIKVGLALLKTLKLSRFVRARNDGINAALAVIGAFAKLLLLANLLLHEGEDLLLELDALLLVQLQEQVFQLFGVLIIDKATDGAWNFLWGEVESHLLNDLVEGLPRHVALLHLEIIGVLQCLLDTILQLVLLHLTLLLDGLVPAVSPCCQLILQCLVLLAGLVSQLLPDCIVNSVELAHEPGSLILIRSVVNLVLKALSLGDVSLVGKRSISIRQLLDLILDVIVLMACVSLVLALELALLAFVLLPEGLFITTLLLHLIHELLVTINLVRESRLVAAFIVLNGT